MSAEAQQPEQPVGAGVKEERELVGLGVVTGDPVHRASSPGYGWTECAKDAVLDKRSKHLRSLLVCALEGGDRGHVGASMSLIEIVGALYHDVARSTRPIRKYRGAIGSASARDPRGSPQKGSPSQRCIGIAASEAAPLIATWATLRYPGAV
jgi:hypothetical protein